MQRVGSLLRDRAVEPREATGRLLAVLGPLLLAGDRAMEAFERPQAPFERPGGGNAGAIGEGGQRLHPQVDPHHRADIDRELLVLLDPEADIADRPVPRLLRDGGREDVDTGRAWGTWGAWCASGSGRAGAWGASCAGHGQVATL